MDANKAFNQLLEEFPFDNYINCEYLSNSYKTITDIVVANLSVDSKILDFGCGPCDKTALLQKLGYNCFGYDDLQDDWHKINNNRDIILNFIKKLGINFIEAKEEKELPFSTSSFDMIMLHDVIEHLHNSPRVLLNDLVDKIKPGGFLFITVPNAGNLKKRLNLMMGKTNLPSFDFYYWSPDPFRDHIREYVKDDLRKLAKNLNLEIIKIKAVDHMLTPNKIPSVFIPLWRAITIIFPSWKDSWLLLAKKPKDWVQNKSPKELIMNDLIPYSSK